MCRILFQVMIWFVVALPVWCMAADSEMGKGREMKLGGECTYKQIPGTATITQVSEADPAAYSCKSGVTVLFSFKPEDPLAVKNYLFPQNSDDRQRLTVGAGMNPSRRWAEKKGLTVGSTHRCVRKEITKGACTPVLFVFPEIDFSDWDEVCFSKDFK